MVKKEKKYNTRQVKAIQESEDEGDEENDYSTEDENLRSDNQSSEEEGRSENEQINCFFTKESEFESETNTPTEEVEQVIDIPDVVTDSSSGSEDENLQNSDEPYNTSTEESETEYFGEIGIHTMQIKEEKRMWIIRDQKEKINFLLAQIYSKERKGIML